MIRLNILTTVVALISQSLWAGEQIGRDEIAKAKTVSAEYISKHKVDRSTQQKIRESLDTVVDTQKIILSEGIEADLKAGLEKHQAQALKEIANLDKKAVPALIQEHTNLAIDKSSSVSGLNSSSLKQIRKSIDIRIEAIEAALKSIGLNAIPFLSDYQALASRKGALKLAHRTNNLINEIVRVGNLEVEKAQLRTMITEAPSSTAPMAAPAEKFNPAEQLNNTETKISVQVPAEAPQVIKDTASNQ